jgi:hypothetical protein
MKSILHHHLFPMDVALMIDITIGGLIYSSNFKKISLTLPTVDYLDFSQKLVNNAANHHFCW